jgi:lantibiotic modifying enzyme
MAAAAPRGPWQPILPDAGAVAEALDELAAALAAPDAVEGRVAGSTGAAGAAGGDRVAGVAGAEEGAAGAPAARAATALADGPAGLALFFHYLDQARPGQGHDARAVSYLETAIQATATAITSPGLYGGFTGIAWALEHLTGRLLEPPAPGEEDPGAEVATALTGYLGHSPWLDDYDLISGLAGIGVWAVERAPRAAAAEAAASVVARLDELAERRDDGVSWRTPPERMLDSEREEYPQGNYNLGVAHGVPGVIGVLGEILAAGLAGDAVRELLAGAVEWLGRQTLPADAASRFAYAAAAAPGNHEVRPSRLAWCYGDPGIALALLGAARAAGEPEWERQALATARVAAARPRDQGGVVDGSLCHGAAGLLHLYNRLYQATGDPLWKTEALAWTERLLAQREPGEGIAGWRSWRPVGEITYPNPELGWANDPGFLTGAAGIGLALLGAVSPVEPAWDRVLLCSVPPRGAAAGGGL